MLERERLSRARLGIEGVGQFTCYACVRQWCISAELLITAYTSSAYTFSIRISPHPGTGKESRVLLALFPLWQLQLSVIERLTHAARSSPPPPYSGGGFNEISKRV